MGGGTEINKVFYSIAVLLSTFVFFGMFLSLFLGLFFPHLKTDNV